jgi:hypothetical protein
MALWASKNAEIWSLGLGGGNLVGPLVVETAGWESVYAKLKPKARKDESEGKKKLVENISKVKRVAGASLKQA